ncbi:MAG: YlmC/YmxH family sporulation protein [Ruminococcus sp.]|nr:YlmC/YmxH family sporulation protein [Ruminococcus sp.]
MICSFSNLKNKEVVNLKTGLKLGYVDDIEIDTTSGSVISLIVFGRPRAMGLLGRDDDIIIKCSDIDLIGEDTILVRFLNDTTCTKSRSFIAENLLK